MNSWRVILFLSWIVVLSAFGDTRPAGRVVWWGKDFFWKRMYSEHTNGVLELGDETLSDAVEIAAHFVTVLALRSDGTVTGFGHNFLGVTDVPSGLSNVVSVAIAGNSAWAIKRDGNAIRWGESDEDHTGIVDGLTNVAAVAWAGDRSYLVLKHDSLVLGLRFDGSPGIDPTTGLPIQGSPGIDPTTRLPIPGSDYSPIQQVEVRGQVLSNVVALSMGHTPLVLKNDGMVLQLRREILGTPYRYTSADPVTIDGKILRNVAALASGGGHVLALKSNGTVVAWGDNPYGQTNVPTGLSNVTAIAAGDNLSLALKSDGTVVAWGGNYHGQASVPAGLSNVVAIAAGGMFGMAITTGSVPASVYVRPHGRLEELEREADIVFKGRVVSTEAVTNASFPLWGKPHATRFQVISTLKGTLDTNELTFWHNTAGPMGWGGGTPPSHHQFQTGHCYLVFAVNLDTPAYLYAPPPDAAKRLGEFRQTVNGGVMRCVDNRAVAGTDIKSVHWQELNLLLNDTNPTNQIYGIDQLDRLSLAGKRDDEWSRSNDFKRKSVLRLLLPLVTNMNPQVATRAIGCFEVETNAADRLGEFAPALIQVANKSAAAHCRLEAIRSLSGLNPDAVSMALARLLKDPDDGIRVGAVRLLPRFPAEFREPALRESAKDESANVRSVVADVIGAGKYTRLIPVLQELFADPVGKDQLIEPLTMEWLKAGHRWDNMGDVHTSAGMALVKFPPEQVADFLKAHLDDPGFHINFVAKLAQGDPEPWLDELSDILEKRLAQVEEIAKAPPLDPKRFADPNPDKVLTGAYVKCWEDIRQYLLKKTPEELASGRFDHLMDLLEKTVRPVSGCPGCSVQEARWLYELYWTKGTAKRVGDLRRKFNQTEGWWFDDFNKRGQEAQLDAITF